MSVSAAIVTFAKVAPVAVTAVEAISAALSQIKDPDSREQALEIFAKDGRYSEVETVELRRLCDSRLAEANAMIDARPPIFG